MRWPGPARSTRSTTRRCSTPASCSATAWSDDGLIEAVESDDVLGVQWHPERLFDSDARHLAPFQWLVGAA